MKNKNFRSLAILLTALICLVNFNAGWAKPIDEKIKGAIDDCADSLKKGIDHLGDNLAEVQNYLDQYHWKGVIQDEASSKGVTLKDLQLNSHAKAAVVRPGEWIKGDVTYHLDHDKRSSLNSYRVVLGIYGPRSANGNWHEFDLARDKDSERFNVMAPQEPGIYQICFRVRENLSDVKEKGEKPDPKTTIGVIVVK